jgi:hypothetical protein
MTRIFAVVLLALASGCDANQPDAGPSPTAIFGPTNGKSQPTFVCQPANTDWRKGYNICGASAYSSADWTPCVFHDLVVMDAKKYLGAAGLELVSWYVDGPKTRRYYVYWVDTFNVQIAGYGHYLYAAADCGTVHKRLQLRVQ